ncbi:MAG TPA: crotonyl-CoA carboxylase/reductase [Dehalococcoidia bacterium]
MKLDLGVVPEALGWTPEKMKAVVIRPEREGPPSQAMQIEEVDVPEPGPNEALVLVMAAGVNYNGVWASRGEPVSVMRITKDNFHIAGSDASGIVWKVGPGVTRWKPGDEVIVHCNISCGECPACNGLDPMACEQQRIWGYETNYGSFAQFTKVQSQQLLPKPKNLSWEEAASYALTYFTAYRMLVHQGNLRAGQNVLIWGAAGGLGVFAVQICKVYNATPICVVSSEEKADLLRSLGAEYIIDRREYGFAWKPDETPEETQNRLREMRRFGSKIREFTGGQDPDIVFEHVGASTFPTSVFVCKRFGKVIICGATSGYELEFDVRYLWMRQKQIIGSHFANAFQADEANNLIVKGLVKPVVADVLPFEETAKAHELMAANEHRGKMVIRVQAPAR